MSKIFYDHLIILDDIEIIIREHATSTEEKEELWKLVDELTHHRVMDAILTKLPRHNHEEFLEKFALCPHDEKLFEYLREKTKEDMEEVIKSEITKLKKELITEIRKKK